jgi:hypothetical protein
VLSPDHARDTPTAVAVRGQDARALFSPLPMTLEHVTVLLPNALGGIQARFPGTRLRVRHAAAARDPGQSSRRACRELWIQRCVMRDLIACRILTEASHMPGNASAVFL